MRPLPHPPLDSLHIFPPGAVLLSLLAALLCLALLLAWWWWWRRRHRPSPPPLPQRTGTKAQSDESGFAQLVRSIRDEHLAHETYREGCHALSTATKTHLEQSSGNDAEEMTVDEIIAWVDEPDVRTFFSQLRSHQFGKRLPGRTDFKKMCRDAPSVLGGGNPRGRKT